MVSKGATSWRFHCCDEKQKLFAAVPAEPRLQQSLTRLHPLAVSSEAVQGVFINFDFSKISFGDILFIFCQPIFWFVLIND
jgi:hypothetical protein